jgi:hypothetical protein
MPRDTGGILREFYTLPSRDIVRSIPETFRERRLSSLHVTTTPRTPSPQWQPQQGSPVFAVLGGSSGAGIVLAILNEHLPQEVAPMKTNLLLQAREMQFGMPIIRLLSCSPALRAVLPLQVFEQFTIDLSPYLYSLPSAPVPPAWSSQG